MGSCISVRRHLASVLKNESRGKPKRHYNQERTIMSRAGFVVIHTNETFLTAIFKQAESVQCWFGFTLGMQLKQKWSVNETNHLRAMWFLTWIRIRGSNNISWSNSLWHACSGLNVRQNLYAHGTPPTWWWMTRYFKVHQNSGRQTHRDRQTEKSIQTDRHIKKGRQTERQADRQTDMRDFLDGAINQLFLMNACQRFWAAGLCLLGFMPSIRAVPSPQLYFLHSEMTPCQKWTCHQHFQSE